jgi:hypothetical protein
MSKEEVFKFSQVCSERDAACVYAEAWADKNVAGPKGTDNWYAQVLEKARELVNSGELSALVEAQDPAES